MRGAKIAIRDLRFNYGEESFTLSMPKLDVSPAEKVVIIGPSGCGKTTFLHLVASILSPIAGTLHINDVSLWDASETRRRRFRISEIGLIFQEFELLEHLTVRENILLPYYINRALTLDAAVEQRAQDLAQRSKLTPLLRRKPRHLSQGERQRVAICRALVTGPSLILADEPTGNLDPKTTRGVLDSMFNEVEEHGATLIVVTHDHSLLSRFDRTLDFDEFDRLDAGRERIDAQSGSTDRSAEPAEGSQP